MIHLITGLPGSGKTLYTLGYVRQLAADGREVYYNGIPELKLPWIHLDNPEKWYELPARSIIVLDEAQTTFRPRGNGAHVPAYVSELETHRHHGFDIVIMTQHPMLLDANVRRLVGRHFHMMRTFGMQRATAHEWGSVKEQCDKSRGDSVKHLFSYPIADYALYKSADAHTHKRRIPMRLLMLLLFPLALGACVWTGYFLYQRSIDRSQKLGGKVAAPEPGSPFSVPAGSNIGRKQEMKTTAEFLRERTPLVAGLPHTAPIYEKVTEPKVAPAPVACVNLPSKGCRCYTSQGTMITNMTELVCNSIVAHGFFMDWVEPVIGASGAAGGFGKQAAVVMPQTVQRAANGALAVPEPVLEAAAPIVQRAPAEQQTFVPVAPAAAGGGGSGSAPSVAIDSVIRRR